MISPLHYRILQISYKRRLGHLSSNLTAVDIIDHIYRHKKPEDLFILSAGHAGLALYVNLEKHEGRNAEELYKKFGTHPHRSPSDGIHVSSGSLGCGITIALGMAMANENRNVHCLISDGESWEGSCSEVLYLKRKFKVDNLKLYINANGYSCIEEVWSPLKGAHDIDWWITDDIYMDYPFIKGIKAHYHNLTDEDWAWVEAHK